MAKSYCRKCKFFVEDERRTCKYPANIRYVIEESFLDIEEKIEYIDSHLLKIDGN